MPLVKGIQQKLGNDRLAVLLLSIDKSYGSEQPNLAFENKKRLQEAEVDFPNVLLAHGFDDCQRKFNLDGYGLTLIGPDGVVRGVDIRADDAERLLHQIYK